LKLIFTHRLLDCFVELSKGSLGMLIELREQISPLEDLYGPVARPTGRQYAGSEPTIHLLRIEANDADRRGTRVRKKQETDKRNGTDQPLLPELARKSEKCC
jgi:hypothetical protein